MISRDEISDYLPTFLSHGSDKAFLEEIRDFLYKNSKKPFYTSALQHQQILFQGDGLEDLLIVNLPDLTSVFPGNKRMFSSSITYAPIFSLQKYLDALRKEHGEEKLSAHEADIRQQLITQIFFLPNGGRLGGDCLVFLDKVISASSEIIEREKVPAIRLFTLSDFGAWLFALKLSIHFCRIRDRVDRTAGVIGS